MNSQLDRAARTALLTLLVGCSVASIPALAEEASSTTMVDAVCLLVAVEPAEPGGGLAVTAQPEGILDPALAELLGFAMLAEGAVDHPSTWLLCEPDPGSVTDLDTAVWSRTGSNTATTAEP